MKRTVLRVWWQCAGCAALLCGVSACVGADRAVARHGAELRGAGRLDRDQHRHRAPSPAISGSALAARSPAFLRARRVGTIHAADAVALAAQNSVVTAYNSLASQACTQDLTGQDLGGLTLTPGVYCFSSSASADRHPHAQRPGQPERRLHLQDREHAHDRERLVGRRDQRRLAVQRVLAGRQLRDARNDHDVRAATSSR